MQTDEKDAVPATTNDDVPVVAEPVLDDEQLASVLKNDPDFFLRHPSLLAELNLPHASGKAVSLVERQVSILRERNVDARRRMNELVHTARVNDELFTKTRSLTLALLDADTIPALNEVLATFVLVDFEADFVCCHLIGKDTTFDHIRSHREAIGFAHLLPGDGPTCTTLRASELATVFPNALHEDTSSAVLLPLDLAAPAGSGNVTLTGALCIGSRDPQRFAPDMDTLFVTYIAQVLAKVLARLR